MPKRIKITSTGIETIAELNDSATAQAIQDKLPLTGYANLWGDEIYFSIPVILLHESSRDTVEIGDLGYWPEGNAFCIFFGPTPISKGAEIKPASAVNIFGKIIDDTAKLKQVKSGAKLVVAREIEQT